MFKKRFFYFVLLIIVAIIGGFFWYYYVQNKELNNKSNFISEKAALSNIEVIVSATGTVKAMNSVDVSSNIAGTIKKMLVQENQVVTKGQLLVRMDSDKLKSQLSQAIAKFENSKTQYERMQKMHKSGVIARKDYDDAYMNYVIAKEQCEELQAQMRDTDIIAPMNGTVIGKPKNEGESVVTGGNTPMVLLTIADLEKMQVETQVDAADIGKIHLGQEATFTVDAYPFKTFKGIISNISKKAVVQQNVVYYSVLVDVENDNDSKLFPGMTARVNIVAQKLKNVIALPLSAVKEKNGSYFVTVIKDNQEIETAVLLGVANDEKVEIKSGIELGEEVVIMKLKNKENNKRSEGAGFKIPLKPHK